LAPAGRRPGHGSHDYRQPGRHGASLALNFSSARARTGRR
jgi:hypothetical protein